MGIGQRKQIKLVQLVTPKAAAGNWQAEVEGEKFSAWAEVSELSAFREYAQGQTQMGHTKRFRVRFRFDKYPGAEWKIVYQGKQWTVTQVTRENERQFYWVLTASMRSDV